MTEQRFTEWLAHKTWVQAVRFSKVLVWLVPPAAFAVDAPRFREGPERLDPAMWWLIGSQVAIELACLAVLAIDRFSPKLRATEAAVNTFGVAVLLLATCLGIADWLLLRDLSIYALGMTFTAAVVCTPRRIRKPLYMLSFLAMLFAIYRVLDDVGLLVAAAVNPFCVAVICIELDKYIYQRYVELFAERERAEAERRRADEVLHNVLPAAVAEELKREGKVAAVKHENMGVMFADIEGFTSYSRSLPPDALVFVLNQIFSAFDALVERHGLEKIKTIGDAYMVVAPQRVQALGQLALDMTRTITDYNVANGTQFQMRIGLHAGPAVAGVIGVKRFLYDVWGDTVNVASRMESTGAPGAIHVADAFYRQTRDSFVFRAREPVQIKGRGLLPSYWLLGPAPPRA